MASRQPDRCIPHVQEVFGGNGWTGSGGDANKRDVTIVAERELKHIEKRMSMKKTIRKQISRQLAQAFVENQDLSPTEEPNRGNLDCNRNDRNTHNLTLTKCRMLAKMDSNFLDLLRHAEDVDPSLAESDENNDAPYSRTTSVTTTTTTTTTDATSGNKKTDSNDPQGNKKVSLWKRLWRADKR